MARPSAREALHGKSLKECGLASVRQKQQPDSDEAAALTELEVLLEKRLAKARAVGVSTRTVEDIFQQARDEAEIP